jgi:hypothetical protein
VSSSSMRTEADLASGSASAPTRRPQSNGSDNTAGYRDVLFEMRGKVRFSNRPFGVKHLFLTDYPPLQR